MAYEPDRHNRKSTRLKGYDYSPPGYYYVTICTHDRIERFGEVENGQMFLKDVGKMVSAEWNRIPERYEHVVLDEYKIMPNHMHGMLEIKCRGGVTPPSNKTDNHCGTAHRKTRQSVTHWCPRTGLYGWRCGRGNRAPHSAMPLGKVIGC